MATLVPDTLPLAEWMQVLDQIDQALAQWLDKVVEPAGALPLPMTTRPPREGLDERLRRLQETLDRCAANAAAADAALAAEAGALDGWWQEVRRLAHGLSSA
jgi:hypothetical protein